MTTLQKATRTSFVRERRSSRGRTKQALQPTGQSTRKSYHPASVFLPVKPRLVEKRSPSQKGRKSGSNGYDIAFTLGQTRIHAPTFNLPQLGLRWVSLGSSLLLAIILYMLWSASPFLVSSAQVRGNYRLDAAEINSMLTIISQPIVKAVPSMIEADLHAAFPDLESIKVQALFPNILRVDVVERTPLIAWYLNGAVTWIDANGMSFTPRGDVAGLIQVAASGDPIPPAENLDLPLVEQKYISPEMVKALLALAPDVPQGMPMIYDPLYGMGWQDPRGWTTYFGDNANEIALKTKVYTTILDALNQKGVQPALVSVEYLNAPFYK